MNYLAHAYLSFGIPEIAVGNMISDFVKGKKKLDYPPAIQQGIMLHRAIDDFTDSHPVTREAATFFKPDYGRYAGALTDVVYDHFLAADPLIFPAEPALAAFAQKTYEDLSTFTGIFPDRFARMFPYMQSQNWLYNYRFPLGVFNSFGGLQRRAKYMPDPGKACDIFMSNYTALQTCYTGFFPALLNFSNKTLMQLRGNTH